MDAAASCARRMAGRDKLRERSRDGRTSGVEAYGKDVWIRCLSGWHQVLRRCKGPTGPKCHLPEGDGGEKSPILRDERVISRKAIAQGVSDVLRCPVCSCAISFPPFAHGTAGAARVRHSLLPHFRGTTKGKPRADPAARTRNCICGCRPGERRDPYAVQMKLPEVSVALLQHYAHNRRPGLWVPAFAGTTIDYTLQISHRVWHRVEPVHHNVVLGFIDAHGHVKTVRREIPC